MAWTERVNPIRIGDRVAYSASFLRSTGQLTGDVPQGRGIVQNLVRLASTKLAEIEWDRPDLPAWVNVANLSRVTDKGILD
jgi:hypothetical protein